MNWEAIQAAVRTVASGDPTKVEGAGYKVYQVGEIVRIDLDSDRIREEALSGARDSQT